MRHAVRRFALTLSLTLAASAAGAETSLRSAWETAARNAAYEKLTANFLAEGWIIYLYHPQYLIAATDQVENFTPMPDGLVRLVGVKLK